MKELKFDELELISGGRGMNEEEKASRFEIDRKCYDLKDYYYSHRRSKEWPAIEEKIHEAAYKWYQAIANAPENHPTIPFSDFFDFEEYKN